MRRGGLGCDGPSARSARSAAEGSRRSAWHCPHGAIAPLCRKSRSYSRIIAFAMLEQQRAAAFPFLGSTRLRSPSRPLIPASATRLPVAAFLSSHGYPPDARCARCASIADEIRDARARPMLSTRPSRSRRKFAWRPAPDRDACLLLRIVARGAFVPGHETLIAGAGPPSNRHSLSRIRQTFAENSAYADLFAAISRRPFVRMSPACRY